MRWILTSWLCLVFPLGLRANSPLEVTNSLWGFTGNTAIEAFVPLTLEVRNLSQTPYDSYIQLEKRIGSSRVGVPEIHSISLAPGGTRIVQFIPYLEQHGYYDWRVSWNGGSHDVTASATPVKDASQVIELMSANSLLQKRKTSFSAFSEQYFPTNASATTLLETVLLAHVPSWDEARAEAFLAWLRRGGHLHLFHGPGGEALRFEGALSDLNVEGSFAAFGNGKIHVHDSALSEAIVSGLRNRHSNADPSNDSRETVWRIFGRSTLPDVPWTLVYLAAFVYLGLIGPGHYLYAKRGKADYRMAILVLLVVVAVFSWIYAKIGRRGYGEADQWLSASIAHSLGNGSYDVEQWAHAFVTKGNAYQFQLPDAKTLFSVQNQDGSIPGYIQGGLQGFLQLDMPLYSSRNLLTRAILPGPTFTPDIVNWDPNARSISLTLATPSSSMQLWYRQNDLFIQLNRTANTWTSGDQDLPINETNHYRYSYESGKLHDLTSSTIERQLKKALTTHLSTTQPQDSAPSEHAELLIWDEAPEAFYPQTPAFQKHFGRVLYVIPLSNLLKES